MKNKNCNACGELVEYNGRPCEDFSIDINDDVICGECGIKSHCFCDYCGEYLPTSDCQSVEIADTEKNYFEVVCDLCFEE